VLQALLRQHVAHYGRAPDLHHARAPGRVNLIGEHTDYNGLPVFPLALQRAVEIVFRPRSDGAVRLANLDDAHGERHFQLGHEIAPFERGDWGNYAKAAAQALHRRAQIERGFDAVVGSDLPEAAGLSSSSALLVACLLALGRANELELERTEWMELAASAERYVGVESGGMDQAISLGGAAGHALVIEFDPLRLHSVAVPDDWRFVIANSLVGAEKSGAAREAYNARVGECREALRLVQADERAHAWPQGYRACFEERGAAELLALGESVLPEPLRRRFRHVVSEAARVASARDAMQNGLLERFGELMNASHASLRDDYEVSCAELDELVLAAREAGAVGARLTGAGFGGCIVALCRAQAAEALVDALRSSFYRGRAAGADSVLIAEASDGASVTRL
jgi:galactokinase